MFRNIRRLGDMGKKVEEWVSWEWGSGLKLGVEELGVEELAGAGTFQNALQQISQLASFF